MRMHFAILVCITIMHSAPTPAANNAPAAEFDPRGKIHIPIGLADSLDSLKTFVEPEGCFSPGFATYGIYFLLQDATGKVTAPTAEGVTRGHGLAGPGYLIPIIAWETKDVAVLTRLMQVQVKAPGGPRLVLGPRSYLLPGPPRLQIVLARSSLENKTKSPIKVSFYVLLRPLGPAGGDVRSLAVSDKGDALLADEHPAVICGRACQAAGVSSNDIGNAQALQAAADRTAQSEKGDCSGWLRSDVVLEPGRTGSVDFICPVLPGRRAVAHQWDGKSTWAQFDLARPHPPEGGHLQPDPPLDFYRKLDSLALRKQAEEYWLNLVGQVRLDLPDPSWQQAFAAITGHVAMAMNEGAPDVAVVNYNVFNRDGVYVVNILQKAGRGDLAERAIDYFLARPFNGRVYPEADNPGQVLWVAGQHWLFTRDWNWLRRVWPSVQRLAELVRYYRTTPPPHYVRTDSLAFGPDLAKEGRWELKPGSCDGHHPEYTEAFDVAALRAAAMLAEAVTAHRPFLGETAKDKSPPPDPAAIRAAKVYRDLADDLFAQYDNRFGAKLPNEYGSYCVLWPCRLYDLGAGKAWEQFRSVGPQKPSGWRYFPLAKAHQGLLAGNRSAGFETVRLHLDHPQMKGWYAFDEGGKSGSGGWKFARTTWDPSVAMPHGWAIAELHLLLRDCLAFEDAGRLVLLGGIDPAWLEGPLRIENLPTWFGPLSLKWTPAPPGPAGGSGAGAGSAAAELELGGAAPPDGFVLRLPAERKAKVTAGGKDVEPQSGNDFVIPPGTKKVRVSLLR